VDPVRSVVLGVVQGLAEPLPISSSAHLVLAPWLLGWPQHGLTYDVALHMGTLAALLLYFWKDWLVLVTAWLPAQTAVAIAEVRGMTGARAATVALSTNAPDPNVASERVQNRRLGIGLVIGTIPAAVTGVLLADVIEESLRTPVLIAVVLIAVSFIMLAADRMGARRVGLHAVTYGQAALIGMAQALALAPGVSRSGITIAAALFIGLTREASARYAFLLAAPVTAGAGVFKLKDLVETGLTPDEQVAFGIGIFTSFAVGLIAIGGLLRYLRRGSLDIFVAYRIALGLLVLAVAALQGA
jgi:undecaprenyl-diphosphatase